MSPVGRHRHKCLVVLLLALGCIQLDDVAGRQCDLQRPCLSGQYCVLGHCTTEAPSSEEPLPGPDVGALFSDDFESGALLLPMGKWEDGASAGSPVTLDVASGRAHRGNHALSLVDPDGASTAPSLVYAALSPSGSTLYWRAWVQLVETNAVGSFDFLWIQNGLSGTSKAQATAGLEGGSLLGVGGNDADGNAYTNTNETLRVGQWQLLELGLSGIGEEAGRVALWLDGEVLHSRNTRWPDDGWRPEEMLVGAVFVNDAAFVGALSVDDLRVSSSPPASRIRLELTPAPTAGQCHPVTVSLTSSLGTLASSPYDLDVSVSSGDVGAEFYDSADCRAPLPQRKVLLPTGSASRRIYVHFSGAGTWEVRGEHPDLLPETVSVDVAARP